MVWNHKNDLTIIEVDADGYVFAEFIVSYGETIPPYAYELLKAANEVEEKADGGFLAIAYRKPTKLVLAKQKQRDSGCCGKSKNCRKLNKRDVH